MTLGASAGRSEGVEPHRPGRAVPLSPHPRPSGVWSEGTAADPHRATVTTPSGDHAADERHPTRPLWKEPPFLLGLVVLVVLAAVIGGLYLFDDADDPEIGLPEPAASPTPTVEPTPELSPTPATPSPSPSPSPVNEPLDPSAPELPEDDERDIVRGDEPDPVEVTGQRSGRTRVVEHEGGLAVIRMAHAGDGGFRARVVDEFGAPVEELSDDEENGEVLADAEGRYSGSRAMVLTEGRYRVQIVADGVWGVRWTQPRYERAPSPPTTISARADLASTPFTVSDSSIDIRWQVNGDDVAVRVINVVGMVSAELTAGDGERTTVDGLGGGLYLLDVRAAEPWRAEIR